MKAITFALIALLSSSTCFAFTIDELKEKGIIPTKIIKANIFSAKNHHEFGSDNNLKYILGFKYKVNGHYITYSASPYSTNVPERYARTYDLLSIDESSFSPNKNYLSIFINDFGDQQDDPGVFHETYSNSQCAVLNFKTGCLLNMDGINDCGVWVDNKSINFGDNGGIIEIIKAINNYKISLLSYIRSHRDFKINKNQDNQEWIQDNFGLENIKACTR